MAITDQNAQTNNNSPLVPGRQAEDSFKRGSDSLLQEKIKEKLHKPRSTGNRAQSLDLTFQLSRITEAGTSVPPDSPTNSNPDEEVSRPTSATAPSFPSVYGPPGSGLGMSFAHRSGSSLHSTGRQARILDDESVEEVNRVIQNLGL